MTQPENITPATADSCVAFSFGDPDPVLEQREWLSYIQALWTGRYYLPPVDTSGLAKIIGASPHHASCINLKVQMLVSRFIPSETVRRGDIARLAQNFLIFGNAYAEAPRNRIGRPLRIRPLLSRFVRIGKDGQYWLCADGKETLIENPVVHLAMPDISQEIYGIPTYLAAVQSALLAEAATLFRRKYYLNGAHAGYILYSTDAFSDRDQVNEIMEAMKNAKGPGNFRNLFLHVPNGKKDGIQVIPIAEVAAKDDFLNMKTVTRDDILAAHRVPPQLLGIIPTNAGGFGSVRDASEVFNRQEIDPLCAMLESLNDQLGAGAIAFAPYTSDPAPPAS